MRASEKKIIWSILLIVVIFFPLFVFAQSSRDFDGDGVPNKDEKEVYRTDPFNVDTDGDGYNDWIELNFGYSPYNDKSVILENSDVDGDGLSDREELKFGINPTVADTDGDGYSDGVEIKNGYDPLSSKDKKLPKRIEINTGAQKLSYFLDGVKRGEFLVSTGKPSTPTPKGHFQVINKNPKAWSSYGLWMPYWMGLGTGRFGIHQLPVWPNGYREGEEHLGKPVSHGCIRLGIDPAEFLYNWTPVGTPVFIY